MEMGPNYAGPDITVIDKKRVYPQNPQSSTLEQAIPLSLLDATTGNFGLTSAIWLFKPNANTSSPCPFTNLTHHLFESLKVSLNSYHQWCGQIKAITALNESDLPPETASFPPHARRFGRLYSRFNILEDPGVELITATSSEKWQDLYPHNRTDPHKPHLWSDPSCHSLKAFSPSTYVATMLAPHNFTSPETNPVLAIQITRLSSPNGEDNDDGGFVLAVKAAHPLADITGLVQFINHWATLTRHMSASNSNGNSKFPAPSDLGLLSPVFKPSLLDDQAEGNINQPQPTESILRNGDSLLPFHRFDWWLLVPDYPSHILPSHIPPAFKQASLNNELKPEGDPMPWSTWNITAPVSTSIIHFTPQQLDLLYDDYSQRGGTPQQTMKNKESTKPTASKHDALLAHIWSRIVVARNFTTQEDMKTPVYCNLTLGLRPALNLPAGFQGSPIVMVPVSTTPSELLDTRTTTPEATSGSDLNIPSLIRSTLSSITTPSMDPLPYGDEQNRNEKSSTKVVNHIPNTPAEHEPQTRSINKILSTYLHKLAYSTSPQRIWQAFLGKRHTLVTSWAKSGIYDIDFGFGHGRALYVDGDLPVADGFVLIKEGGSGDKEAMSGLNISGSSWTDNGVDVSVHLNNSDMERLLNDPLLFPVCPR